MSDDRLLPQPRRALDARAEQVRVPVLRQPGDALRGADAAERAPRPRPAVAHAASSRASGPRSTRSASRACRAGAAGPTPSAGGSARAAGTSAERTSPPGGRRGRPGPRSVGVAQTPQIDDHDAARRRVGEAPVVALDPHAVGAARVAERRVRAGAAVGLEQGHGAPG